MKLSNLHWSLGNKAWLLRTTGVLVLLSCVSAGSAPIFTKEPESVIAKIHSPVKFYCDAEPSSVDIRWTLDNSYIQSDDDRGVQIENNGRTLHILSFKHTRTHRPHVGQYRCVASNEVGKIISRPASLERASLGNFKAQEDVIVNVSVGNVAYLPCDLPKSYPAANTVFEVNATTIDKNTARHFFMPDGSLQIGNVQASDQGLYKCIAINSVSHHKKSAKHFVRLFVHASSGGKPPKVIAGPKKNTEVILGRNLTIRCVMSGMPRPLITWEKYGGQLPPNSRQVLGNLLIESVQLQDTGTYICTGENGHGSPQVEIAMLEVQVPPKIHSAPTDQEVLVGGKAVFRCGTQGQPKVHLVWLHNGEALSADSHIEISDTALTVNNAQSVHAGMYQCVASNRLGTAHAEAQLSIKRGSSLEGNGSSELPTDELLLPSKPEIEQVSRTSLKITWTLYPGMAVTGFKVQHRARKSKWKTAAENIPPTQNEVVLENLRTRSKYQFRVIVEYEGSMVKRGPKTTFRLDPNFTESRPEQQDGTIESDALARDPLTTLPVSPGLPISADTPEPNMVTNATEVTVAETEVVDPETPTLSEDLPEPTPTPKKRGRGRGNNKRRRNRNRNKNSNNKRRNRGKQPGLTDNMIPPTKPEVSQESDTSVLLKWTVPPNDGLQITFFLVQYKEKNPHSKELSKWRTIDENLPENTEMYEVTGLKPGGTYKFRIAAVYSNNDNKLSPVSRSFTITPTDTPRTQAPVLPPVIVDKTSSSSAIEVKWQYLPSDNVEIQGFIISYKPFHSSEPEKTMHVIGSLERRAIITNLEPKTDYSIRMVCFNIMGKSDYSNLVSWSTLPETEEPPCNPLSSFGIFCPKSTTLSPKNPITGKPTPSRNNNKRDDNQVLYMILGGVLGVMVLLLVIFMVLCWWKQRQQKKMMAAMDAKYRNKFQDPSQQIYNSQMGPKKHTNGFLLNGINGHAGNGNVPGHVHPNHQSSHHHNNGKMNINVNPLTELENHEMPSTEDSDATKLADSNPDIPNGHVRPCNNCSGENTVERQRNIQNLQNMLDTDDIARIDYSNFLGTNGSQHSSTDSNSRPQFSTFIGSQGQLAGRPDQLHCNGSVNGSASYLNRSRDQISTNEQSPQSSQVVGKHKRRKKRPAHSSRDNTRDQATNTDISSNEGTLDSQRQHSPQYQSELPPVPHFINNQDCRYANTYEEDD